MKDARVVAAIRQEFDVGLQLVQRFQEGDHVAHISLGEGEVTANDGETVTVTFAQRTRTDGRPTIGHYDAVWFNNHPKFLFHRSEPLDVRLGGADT